jgi:hypothetical protein
MKNIAFASFLFALSLTACSKKSVPSKEETAANSKPAVVYRAPVKTPTPKTIAVSDAAAKKTVDGKYYYDLEGKRYWRNKKDGKYYLYYKGMFDNKDFQ